MARWHIQFLLAEEAFTYHGHVYIEKAYKCAGCEVGRLDFVLFFVGQGEEAKLLLLITGRMDPELPFMYIFGNETMPFAVYFFPNYRWTPIPGSKCCSVFGEPECTIETTCELLKYIEEM